MNSSEWYTGAHAKVFGEKSSFVCNLHWNVSTIKKNWWIGDRYVKKLKNSKILMGESSGCDTVVYYLQFVCMLETFHNKKLKK